MAQTDFTIAEFLAWVRTKPADEQYDYVDADNCAVAQFGRATGRHHLIGIGALDDEYPELEEAVHPLWINKGTFTFGALVARLERLFPDAPVTPSEWTKLDAYLVDA